MRSSQLSNSILVVLSIINDCTLCRRRVKGRASNTPRNEPPLATLRHTTFTFLQLLNIPSVFTVTTVYFSISTHNYSSRLTLEAMLSSYQNGCGLAKPTLPSWRKSIVMLFEDNSVLYSFPPVPVNPLVIKVWLEHKPLNSLHPR